MSVEEEAAAILAKARHTEAARETTRRPIDYARMNRMHPRQKAALTRAIRSGNQARLLVVCRDAVREWDEIGCWPDDWNRWQIALGDALGFRAISRAFAYEAVRRGEIPSIRIGRRVLVPRATLERMLTPGDAREPGDDGDS